MSQVVLVLSKQEYTVLYSKQEWKNVINKENKLPYLLGDSLPGQTISSIISSQCHMAPWEAGANMTRSGEGFPRRASCWLLCSAVFAPFTAAAAFLGAPLLQQRFPLLSQRTPARALSSARFSLPLFLIAVLTSYYSHCFLSVGPSGAQVRYL